VTGCMADGRTLLAASLVNLCKNATIDMGKGVRSTVTCAIVVNLKYVDRKSLLDTLQPGVYVDWDHIDAIKDLASDKHNLLGDSEIWIQMLGFVDFGSMDMACIELKESHPALWALYKTMDENVGHDTPRWTFSDTCKLFLLSNVQRVPFSYVAERYISNRVNSYSSVLGGKILGAMAEERYDQLVYLKTMAFLLQKCVISEDQLAFMLSHYRQTIVDQQSMWAMRDIVTSKCRPSLRHAISVRQLSNRSSMLSVDDVNQIDMGLSRVGFQDFCRIIRFPNCMSHLLRLRCYLLASQGHQFDFTKYTRNLVPDDIAKVVDENAVGIPNADCLVMAIGTLTLNIHPFDKLVAFRTACFSSYANSQTMCLTMSDILKLYVSAYQKPNVWKQLWKSVHPLMSTQISKDVEVFVKMNVFDHESFVTILKTSTPFSV
jgi:hypothetical protein